ncbi:hypothetical protein A3207_06390 [Candidatus Methanomassiliicoccus intestinalis]|uniref:Uncharacterized protein n=1 Tax=Candidatus Methanomassiliicoccus intestinalis TaxID=1406512 RepID=A0A8J8PBT3_9ARCH|nr:MAG: hypothetical protein A3207_06390 [Candidatus Methanomassiliicoccus intestinalis]
MKENQSDIKNLEDKHKMSIILYIFRNGRVQSMMPFLRLRACLIKFDEVETVGILNRNDPYLW